jgi:hypothetical protein
MSMMFFAWKNATVLRAVSLSILEGWVTDAATNPIATNRAITHQRFLNARKKLVFFMV